MRLVDIRDVFVSVLPTATHHYKAWSKPDQYIVWAEDGQAGSAFADNRMQEQAISGTADYFTKIEYDPIFNQIQQAMNDANLSWSLESIQYEEVTRYIHYEWSWEVPNHIG